MESIHPRKLLAFLFISLSLLGLSCLRFVSPAAAKSDNFTCKEDSNDLQTAMRFYTKGLLVSDVSEYIFNDAKPVHSSLFGQVRDLLAKEDELLPYAHPRIVMGESQWEDLLKMYANDATFNEEGTWSNYFRKQSLNHGLSKFIKFMSSIYNTTSTLYKGHAFDVSEEYELYRRSLLPLVRLIEYGNIGNTDSFPQCALWASVALKRAKDGHEPFIPLDTYQICIQAAVAWSKVVLAHRTYYCSPICPTTYNISTQMHLWDYKRRFSLDYMWVSGGTGLAFTYDLLYKFISESDKITIRSAIALVCMNRYAWGTNEFSTRDAPNAIDDPHRIFSNWAGYNSNLYITNLAIEHEIGYDNYTSHVLRSHGKPYGFNKGLNDRYSALLEEYLKHSFYPDGATFEDGYSYFLGLREGTLGLLASHRRGSNILSSPRFKNLIHNAAQMFEPWHCGYLIGHSGGGGNDYNAYAGLFRYVYPNGSLPGMLWRQRFGTYANNKPCRITWWQTRTQLMFVGGEHSSVADCPEALDEDSKNLLQLSYYATRRGLLISRSSLSQNATYMHFDARPDAFLVGHDNADRGIFTFSAHKQTWIDDADWSTNRDSRRHSLVHVDGLAQDLRAPSVKMFKIEDKGAVVIAAADLTYAYNVQWARGHNYNVPPYQQVVVYNDTDGTRQLNWVLFPEPEKSSPWSLGWPVDDKAEDIGFRDDMTLNGEEHIGFSGLWIWKRPYRTNPISRVVRSMGLVRSQKGNHGYGIIVDSILGVGDTEHVFESYLVLHVDVRVNDKVSSCRGDTCLIRLENGKGAFADLHIHALGNNLEYRVEVFGRGPYTRVIISSVRRESEQFWLILYGHIGVSDEIMTSMTSAGTVVVTYEGERKSFATSKEDYSLYLMEGERDEVDVGEVELPEQSMEPFSPMEESDGVATATSESEEIGQDVEVSPETSEGRGETSHSPEEENVGEFAETPTLVSPESMDESDGFQDEEENEEYDEMESESSEEQKGEDEIMENAIRPMQPGYLLKRNLVFQNEMNSNRSTFYNVTAAGDYQVTYIFRSRSNPRRGLRDKIMTCSKKTSMEAVISIYDCGSDGQYDEKYYSRGCKKVESGFKEYRCRYFRTRLMIGLTPRRKYLLVLSMKLVGSRPNLVVRHGRGG